MMTQNVDDEIQEEPLVDKRPSMNKTVNTNIDPTRVDNNNPPLAEIQVPLNEESQQNINQEFQETARRYLGKEQYKTTTTTNVNGNITCEELRDSPKVQMFPLSIQAKTVDLIYKGITSNISDICEKTNIHVEKSPVLSSKWNSLVHKYDEHIKTLSTSKWKTPLVWSAGIITLGIGLYYMSAYLTIPDFLCTLIGSIPTTDVKGNLTEKATSKTTEDVVEALMHTPLTPLSIVVGVGAITIGIRLLKVAVWILRRSPK